MHQAPGKKPHGRRARRYNPRREVHDRQLAILAARLRITTDRKLGKATPQWVIELAQERL